MKTALVVIALTVAAAALFALGYQFKARRLFVSARQKRAEARQLRIDSVLAGFYWRSAQFNRRNDLCILLESGAAHLHNTGELMAVLAAVNEERGVWLNFMRPLLADHELLEFLQAARRNHWTLFETGDVAWRVAEFHKYFAGN